MYSVWLGKHRTRSHRYELHISAVQHNSHSCLTHTLLHVFSYKTWHRLVNYCALIKLVWLKALQLHDNKHLTWPVVTSPPEHWVPSIPHVWHFISFRSYCGVTFLPYARVSPGPQRRHAELSHWDRPGGLDSTMSSPSSIYTPFISLKPNVIHSRT